MKFSQYGNLHEASIKIVDGINCELRIFNSGFTDLKCPIQCLINGRTVQRCDSIDSAKEYFRTIFKNFAAKILEYTDISEISTGFLEVIYDNNGNPIMQRIFKNGHTVILRPALFIDIKNMESKVNQNNGHKEYELIMSDESFYALLEENEKPDKPDPILEEIKKTFSKKHFEQLLPKNRNSIYYDHSLKVGDLHYHVEAKIISTSHSIEFEFYHIEQRIQLL